MNVYKNGAFGGLWESEERALKGSGSSTNCIQTVYVEEISEGKFKF